MSVGDSWRLRCLGLVLATAFCVLTGRLVYLHLVFHESALVQVSQQRERTRFFEARRGDIRDARGELLASTREVFEVGLDPEIFSGAREDIEALSAILEIPLAEVIAAAQRGTFADGRPVRWRRLLDAATPTQMRELRVREIPGLCEDRRYVRSYPHGGLASHVIGFLRRDGEPVMGLERDLDFYLRGQRGWEVAEVDGRRRHLARFSQRNVPAQAGYDLHLTVDHFVQAHVEATLGKHVEELDPQWACVLVSDVATGSILALANYPGFDPNHYIEQPVDWQRNRAAMDIFEPGSVFKIVPVGRALDLGRVRPDTRFDCAPAFASIEERRLRLPRDHHAFGQLTVSEIVSRSSNRGAALLGIAIGAKELYAAARAYGFGERTGLLAYEEQGFLAPPRDWDGLTITRLPMGHAVGATALQVHQAMAVVANDGIAMRPRIVAEVRAASGEPVAAFPPRARLRVLTPETAAELQQMLADAVGSQGTAQRAALPEITVAGKTGTTQKIINGRYSDQEHVGTFSGFFPAQDPRFVITVVVDGAQVEGIAYGGRVAAPIFREIAAFLVREFNITPPARFANL